MANEWRHCENIMVRVAARADAAEEHMKVLRFMAFADRAHEVEYYDF